MSIISKGTQLWKSEKSYLVFFLIIFLSDFAINPFYEGSDTGRILGKIFILFIILSGTAVITKSKFYIWLVGILAFMDLFLLIYTSAKSDRNLEIAGDIFQITFYLIFITLLLVKAFRDEESNIIRVMGAVAGYLMIANMFAITYHLLYILYGPTVFNFPDLQEGRGLLYFSFYTLTTVGYGDIVPIHPVARSLSNIEALIGQLYPAILIARLITPAGKAT